MKKWSIVILLAFWITTPQAEEREDFKDVVLATPALIEQIKQGGYVIYMRHGKTNTRIPDQVPIDLNDCATQRPLTDEGLAEVAQIGRWFKQLGIPYSAVYASPLCRAEQTARATFGDDVTIEINLQYTAALTTAEKQPIIAKTYELLSSPVDKGSNRVLVAHGPNLVEMMRYFPPEGSIVFYKPLADQGFEYLGTITPDHWPQLLKQMGF